MLSISGYSPAICEHDVRRSRIRATDGTYTTFAGTYKQPPEILSNSYPRTSAQNYSSISLMHKKLKPKSEEPTDIGSLPNKKAPTWGAFLGVIL